MQIGYLNLMFGSFLLTLIISSCFALYEDQIGVFDWNQHFVGNVQFVEQNFIPLSETYLFGSERNVLASVNAGNGSIVWRQVLEDHGYLDDLVICDRTAISLSSVPYPVARAWNALSGSIIWEKTFDWSNSPNCKCGPVTGTLLCYSGKSLMLVSLYSGKELWFDEKTMPAFIDYLSTGQKHNDTHRILSSVGAFPTQDGLVKVNLLLLADGSKPPIVWDTVSIRKPQDWKNNGCLIMQSVNNPSNYFLTCVSPGANHSSLELISLGDANSKWITFPLNQNRTTLKLLTPNTFVAHSVDHMAQIFQLDASGQPMFKFSISQATFLSKATFSNRDFLFAAYQMGTNFKLDVYDLTTGHLSSELPNQHWNIPKHHGKVVSIYASIYRPSRSDSLGYRVLLKTQDHAILMYRETGQLQWVREEALADISAVELVDLPVSESQARMEEEFGHAPRNVFKMFIKRLRTQGAQLMAFLENNLHKARDLILSYSSKSALFSPDPFPMTSRLSFPPKLVSEADTEQQQPPEIRRFLTRDTFNMHKMIVVATAVGKLFGLESNKGRIVWEHLVSDVKPLANGKLTLILQRSTAHFPLPPVTTLIMRSKRTHLPMLFSFNPITGAPMQQAGSSDHIFRFPLDAKQAVALPGPIGEDTDYLRPILLLDEHYQVHLYPPEYNQSWKPDLPPLYLYTVEPTLGRLSGYQVHTPTAAQGPASTSRVWQMYLQSSLSNDSHSIVAVASRPSSEHIHSVGRVLGDRSVLYKYLNPNLIAVLTISGNRLAQTDMLTMYLIDVVAGRVVYSTVHRRCSEPINLIVSENWIVYTYHNHKSLRHEATVLELFEPSTNGEPCAAYSIPRPVQLFLQNILAPTGWLSQPTSQMDKQQQQPPDSSNHKGPRPLNTVGSRAIFSSLYRTTDVDGMCVTTGRSSLIPQVLQQSYIFPTPPIHGAAAVSLTERGITSKSIIFGLQKGALIELPKSFFDPRRTLDMTPQLAEEGVHPYAPVLPLSDQSVITFNQTVMGIRAVRTAMTGLESTSLVFAYGLDMFFTRIAPSQTYDLLKEDFDYTAIAMVTLGMIVASVVTQRLAARRAMFRAWT